MQEACRKPELRRHQPGTLEILLSQEFFFSSEGQSKTLATSETELFVTLANV